VEANTVPDAKGWQFAAVDKPVDSRATDLEQSCHIRHPEQLVRGEIRTAVSR